jgi:hypothetical protein
MTLGGWLTFWIMANRKLGTIEYKFEDNELDPDLNWETLQRRLRSTGRKIKMLRATMAKIRAKRKSRARVSAQTARRQRSRPSSARV